MNALVPPWIGTTLGAAAVALAIAFLAGSRVLRPMGELTRAARRMRAGDLDVRVTADAETLLPGRNATARDPS
jgi:HAMP domain-containing protein